MGYVLNYVRLPSKYLDMFLKILGEGRGWPSWELENRHLTAGTVTQAVTCSVISSRLPTHNSAPGRIL